MNISASIINEGPTHKVIVQTNDAQQNLSIPSKEAGQGSAVNGGELLCLALATCFCNDIYREAKKKGMKVNKVTVDAWAEFNGEGQSGAGFCYRAALDADASEEEIRNLVVHTDRVAEIQKTLREGVSVSLVI